MTPLHVHEAKRHAELIDSASQHPTEAESLFQGLYSAVLTRHFFPFPEYIIAPHYPATSWLPGKQTVDMCVIRSCNRHAVMVFEGRQEGLKELGFASVLTQLAGNFQTLGKHHRKGPMAAMIASGRKIAFVRGGTRHGGKDLTQLAVNDEGEVYEMHGGIHMHHVYDIAANTTEIDRIIQHIKAFDNAVHQGCYACKGHSK